MMKRWIVALLLIAATSATNALAQPQDFCKAESSVKLEYTPEAVDGRLMGDIVLKLQLGDDGEVRDVTVVSGHSKALADAAVTIAKSSVISCTEGWAGDVFEDVFKFVLKMKREGKVIHRSATVNRTVRPWSLRPTEPIVSTSCSPAASAQPPSYPREALMKEIEGTVSVEGKIAPNGRATDLVLPKAAVMPALIRPSFDSQSRPNSPVPRHRGNW